MALPCTTSTEHLPHLPPPPLNCTSTSVLQGGGKLLPLSMRQRIFFKYEKRIRDLSSLEKIYEYFATHEHAGTKVMTSQDVVRALVPTYPPVGSNVVRAGFLDGERMCSAGDRLNSVCVCVWHGLCCAVGWLLMVDC